MREEQEVEDVKSHCDAICSKVDGAMVESCGGSECKAQVSQRPPRRNDILLMAAVVRCAGYTGLDERCLVSIGKRERTVGRLGSEINKSDGSVQQDRCIIFQIYDRSLLHGVSRWYMNALQCSRTRPICSLVSSTFIHRRRRRGSR